MGALTSGIYYMSCRNTSSKMKPIMLHGHERSITQIKYSREGDLIYSCAKDAQPNVWYSLNGERLGSFNGHNGAVWCIDVDWNTTKVLTGAADNTCKLWDAHENGDLRQYELKTGDMLRSTKGHNKQINDIQLSKDGMFFITASKDFSAKLFDLDNMDILKTYKTERPVNSASISPLFDHVVLGGGQEAMSVTTTSTRIGKFDARFFHMIFEEEFGSVKGHFGPINSLSFHPDGKSYSSGGEDGFVRVNYFDPTYLDP